MFEAPHHEILSIPLLPPHILLRHFQPVFSFKVKDQDSHQ